MNIILKKETADAIGPNKLIPYGMTEMGWAHRERREIDLQVLSVTRLEQLTALLKPHVKLRGVQTALHNIKIWQRAMSGDANQVARNALQMSTLMKKYLEPIAGHRLFKHAYEQWFCYYVNKIEYHPRETSHGGGTIPPRVYLRLLYEELGGRKEKMLRWNEDEVAHKSPAAILREIDYYPETDELRAQYLDERTRFLAYQPQIGMQIRMWGTGTDNLDELNEDDDDDYDWKTKTYAIGTPEEPGRGVIDVFHENTKSKRDREDKVSIILGFWERQTLKTAGEFGDDPEDTEADDDDSDSMQGPVKAAPGLPEVPIHPTLATFDLKKHERLRVHVNNVEPYVYDKLLAEKLVLKKELKDLVALLVEHKAGGFKDLIVGKGGGAIVLLCGKPGTGKTLTAEVYAESEQRALYSVQCSQLGTDPDDLEKALEKCFIRSSRWNAVMLLDEADVYVHVRGNDLIQNAIVGVFLRVLEYQSAVMFLTTNRPDDVDDAVASRCIAKLTYEAPSPPDQKKIWRILAESSGITISDDDINRIVTKNEHLTGRDVKNLLKLGMLMAQGKPVTAKIIEYVKQFKPTTEA